MSPETREKMRALVTTHEQALAMGWLFAAFEHIEATAERCYTAGGPMESRFFNGYTLDDRNEAWLEAVGTLYATEVEGTPPEEFDLGGGEHVLVCAALGTILCWPKDMLALLFRPHADLLAIRELEGAPQDDMTDNLLQLLEFTTREQWLIEARTLGA